jgi:hypothetical protein
MKRPDGIGETEELLRKLVQVPKRELDAEVERDRERRKKKAAVRKKKS